MIILIIGYSTFATLSVYSGLIMYAHYADCDPISSKVVEHGDQLFASYVVSVAKDVPGLPGLFISGLFSASLR